MRKDFAHQELADAAAAKPRKDEYIQQVRIANVVAYHPCKGDLAALGIGAKTQGVLDAFFDARSRYPGNPIGMIGEEGMDHGHIQPALVSRDLDGIHFFSTLFGATSP